MAQHHGGTSVQNIDLVHGCIVDDRACSWYIACTQYHVRSIIDGFGKRSTLKIVPAILWWSQVAHYLVSVHQTFVFLRHTTFKVRHNHVPYSAQITVNL